MSNSPDFKRLFIAIELPEDIRCHLDMSSTTLSGVKWTQAHQLHLTLRFIGNILTKKIGDLKQALQTVSCHVFPLHLQCIGTFTKKESGILWAGVEASTALQCLKCQVDNAILQSLKLPPEEAKYTPHITLARVRMPFPPAIEDLLTSYKIDVSFKVRHFVLCSSLLTAKGAIYRHEAKFALPVL